MRPVSGFERPIVQWLFVALGLLLIVVAGGAAWTARRANGEMAAARAAEEGLRLERNNLESQLARERSTREALTLELARAREDSTVPARVMPTLTLKPLAARGASPPEPTVSTQHATQIIELRLVLPAGARPYTRFEAVMREWTSGRLVWARGGLTPSTIDRQPMLTAFVTGDLFRAGPYEVRLSAIAADGDLATIASYEVAFK